MSLKIFCVTDDLIVHKFLRKNADTGIFVCNEVAGRTVLFVNVFCMSQARKPYKFLQVYFDRITFDQNGEYDYRHAILSPKFRTELEYMAWEFNGSSNLYGEISEPLPIPITPALPTVEELKTIKRYLNDMYPMLLHNDPSFIERRIIDIKADHKEKIKMLKQSHV